MGYYLRRKSDGQWFYYLNGETTGTSPKMKDAVMFNELEVARGFKRQLEKMRDEKFEIVSIVTKIDVINEEEQVEVNDL